MSAIRDFEGIFPAGMATGESIRQASGVVRILPVGVDERLRYALALFFKTKLNDQFMFAGAGEVDIRIVDLDSYTGHALWTHRRDNESSLPTILLSIDEVDTDANTWHVRKPVRLEALERALTGVASTSRGDQQAMQSQDRKRASDAPVHRATEAVAIARPVPVSVSSTPEEGNGEAQRPFSGRVGFKLAALSPQSFLGSAPDIDPSDPQQVANALFDPNEYLIGKLLKAKELCHSSKRAIRMVTNRGAITIVPASDQVAMDILPKQLRALGSVPLLEGDVQFHFVKEPSLPGVPEHQIWRLESLQWTLMLLASRGRVPVGTGLDQEIALNRWPNLTRLLSFPSAIRITALLSREPMSLIEAAKTLKVPQRYVFAFFAAASSLGLIERRDLSSTGERRPDAAGAETDVPGPAKRRRLFEKILSHLRK